MEKKKLILGFLIIILYSLALNLPFLWEREFQGEAARRAVAALEMMERGDYLIPYIEGRPYLLKPPGYNWVLIGFFKLFGSHSEFVVRLSSVTAATLCALFLALLFRAVARPSGLLWVLPGLVFLSIPEVLDKACRAEIDMTYTLLVTVSVFSWFYFHEIQKRPYWAWAVALGFVALGTLTKTFQALVFFYTATGSYLFFQKRFQEFFSPAHLLGFSVYAGIFSLWLIPAAQKVGAERIFSAWFGEYFSKKNALDSSGFWGHFLGFPLEYLEGYLPWIVFLLLWWRFWKKDFYRNLPEKLKDLAFFSLLLVGLSFPLYWLPPGSRLRYLLPTAGGLAFLVSIPLTYALYKNQELIWVRRSFRFLAILLLLAIPVFAFVSYSRLYLYENIWVWPALALSIILALSLFIVHSLRGSFVVFFLLLAALRLTYGASYFPYQEKYRNHYLKAAQKIAKFIPQGSTLCTYPNDSPHLVYHLKYRLKKVKDMKRISDLKKASTICSYLLSGQKLNSSEWTLLLSLKARRTPWWLYQRRKNVSQ